MSKSVESKIIEKKVEEKKVEEVETNVPPPTTTSTTNYQLLLDNLYGQFSTQHIRYKHISSRIPKNRMYLETEKAVLSKLADLYRQFYVDRAEDIKQKLTKLKTYNTSSYFTYDVEYYVNQYNDRMEEINKYLVELQARTPDQLMTDDLSTISTEINSVYSELLPTPTLLR